MKQTQLRRLEQLERVSQTRRLSKKESREMNMLIEVWECENNKEWIGLN